MLTSLGLDLEVGHLWLLAGCAIAVVELLLVGSYYLLALAVGAVVVGIAASVTELSTTMQWLVFILATGAATGLLYLLRSNNDDSDIDNISFMVGKQVQVVEKVCPRGRVVYKSVTWAAESEEHIEKGAKALITSVNGSTLFTTKIKENNA